MATSVSNNAYGIIVDAMVDAGWLQEGDRPNSEQLASYLRRLNDIINLWQTQGLKLFLEQEVNIPLTVSQGLYSIGPTGTVVMAKPTRILSGYVTSVSGVRRPLTLISRDDYDRLSQVIGNAGAINSFFVDKRSYQLDVYLWPSPNAAEVLNTATFLTQIQAAGPLFLTDQTSFPQEWRIALRWALADDIATGQPESIMNRCAQRATAYRTVLEDWDVEDASTRVTIGDRAYGTSGRFR